MAYGSNMLESRLRAYIEGAGPGLYGSHRGSRDRRWPTENRSVRTNHDIYFAGHSVRWNGPVAFLDLVSSDSYSLVRAYLLGLSQITDLTAQENGDIAPLSNWNLPSVNDCVELPTSGKYNAILRLEDYNDFPMVTLTTSRDLPRGEPTAEYLATMRQGLREVGDTPNENVNLYIDTLLSRT